MNLRRNFWRFYFSCFLLSLLWRNYSILEHQIDWLIIIVWVELIWLNLLVVLVINMVGVVFGKDWSHERRLAQISTNKWHWRMHLLSAEVSDRSDTHHFVPTRYCTREELALSWAWITRTYSTLAVIIGHVAYDATWGRASRWGRQIALIGCPRTPNLSLVWLNLLGLLGWHCSGRGNLADGQVFSALVHEGMIHHHSTVLLITITIELLNLLVIGSWYCMKSLSELV